MGMKIDIDSSIKEFSKWRKNLNYDTGDYCYGGNTTEYSLDCAIKIMRKYKKIQEIYDRFQKDGNYYHHMAWLNTMEVIEDENDN